MDFSTLTDALASKSYHMIAEICDGMMLQVASDGIAFRDKWPYSIHLLGHIYIDDINSARFLWKTIPLSLKESQPEVAAVWKIAQRLWTKDFGGVHETIREFSWSSEIRAIVAGFSDALQHGWSVDPSSRMLTVKKEIVPKVQKLDPSKLQRLTEYVFHLDH